MERIRYFRKREWQEQRHRSRKNITCSRKILVWWQSIDDWRGWGGKGCGGVVIGEDLRKVDSHGNTCVP